MYIPRFAYNDAGEILYIKQGCSVAGTWQIPEIFTYETEKRDFSLAGIWLEYNPLSSKSKVDTKLKKMNGENNTYGFIANTIATNANNDETYNSTIETFIANSVGVGVPDDPQLTEPENSNRTILKIINTNKIEPIKGTATLNEEELTITTNVTYNTNQISKIINEDGKILSENSNTARDTELLGNGTYKYIVIDNLGNLKEITIKVEGLKIYVIPNLKRLKEFRDEVNAGNSFSGITVIQTADIAMNEGKYTIDEETGDIVFAEDAEQWVPIGDYANDGYYFNGTYDGKGHIISGIYINNEYNYQGLFGYARYAIIKNLGIEKSKIMSTQNYVGGLVGCASADIENCYNLAEVSGNQDVGGLVGYAVGDISNCYNAGNVTSTEISYDSRVGGIVGKASGDISNCYNKGNITGTNRYVGGVIGTFNSKSISNCYNVGKITGEEYAGGISGSASTTGDLNISKSFNLGEISAKKHAAGILGIGSHSASGHITVQECYNVGNVITTGNYSNTGGITTEADRILNCYNKGNLESYYDGDSYGVGGISARIIYSGNGGSLMSNYNIGSLKGKCVGGLLYSCNNRDTISNNYYLEGTAEYGIYNYNGQNYSADRGTEAVSSEELKGKAADLGEEIWKNDIGINDGYPILAWQTDNDKLNLINGDNAFVEDTQGLNGGYPLLSWQVK